MSKLEAIIVVIVLVVALIPIIVMLIDSWGLKG